jgi:small neutral amino acid transporter SnatA (MarC family)
VVFLFSDLLFFFNLDPLLKRHLLAGVLLEWEQDRNSQVVFTFAGLGYFVLLFSCFMGQLLLKFRFCFFRIAVV